MVYLTPNNKKIECHVNVIYALSLMCIFQMYWMPNWFSTYIYKSMVGVIWPKNSLGSKTGFADCYKYTHLFGSNSTTKFIKIFLAEKKIFNLVPRTLRLCPKTNSTRTIITQCNQSCHYADFILQIHYCYCQQFIATESQNAKEFLSLYKYC